MKRIVIIAALTLAGCVAPEPLVVTKKVEVPVAVTCVNAGDVPPVPEKATDSLSAGDDMLVKTKALLQDFRVLEANNRVLRALVSGCLAGESG